MATFTIRADEKQEKALDSFMEKSNFAAKTKAVLWLIENAERLVKNDEILCELVKAEREKNKAIEKLKNVKSPNLNEYF
ncbi:hypothetical protein ACRWQL_01090 [Shewanella sp. HL-SH4]|uniref:hypothetical protein n=1 Tax=Shewanella sp. HL-SH4 TaxID=3436240 RepID=UPI003EBCB6CB